MTARLIALFFLLLSSSSSAAVEIWVSPGGNDTHDGSLAAPYATLEQALRQARELRRLEDPAIEGGIHIVLADGVFRLIEPLFVRVEDSGTTASPTVFRAAPGAEPVLSGGVPVRGWSQPRMDQGIGLPPEGNGNVCSAEAPRVAGRTFAFRELWVNGFRAQRAREKDGEEFDRILEWNKAERACWIPAESVRNLSDCEGLEMVVHQMWAIAILRVKSISVQGERARVDFHEPEGRVQWEHPWPPVVISETGGNSAFYLANRMEFLDEPGEWMCRGGDKVVYAPREGETIGTVEAIAPYLETLVRIEGTADHPVQNVRFDGIRFQHTTWNRPSEKGHVPLQAGFSMVEAYKLREPGTPDKAGLENQAWVERQPAAVELRHVRNTRFERCFFEHLAASGLDYVVGADGDVVEGNVFRDIGGNGFVAGAFQEGPVETHVPYTTSDERDLVQNLVFRNNLVTDVANTDWGCVGVAAGYVRGIELAHNEICDVAYSGISLGWGWTKTVTVMRDNHVVGNHIHHFGKHMYDTGGIYTLSPQPGSVIERNAIHSINEPTYVHDPHHWSFIYLDEGSSFITVRDNWTERIKFSTNANGPGNVWRGNGPDVDPTIRDSAGLEAPFRDLLKTCGWMEADHQE